MSWDQNAIDDFLHEGNIGNSSHTLLPGSPGAPAGSVSGKDSVRSLRTPTMTRSRSHSAISVASNISRVCHCSTVICHTMDALYHDMGLSVLWLVNPLAQGYRDKAGLTLVSLNFRDTN